MTSTDTIVRPANVKYLNVNQPYGMPGCTNGRSGQTDQILLANDHGVRTTRDRYPNDVARNVFEVVLWNPTGTPAAHLRPIVRAPHGTVGYMNGGNTVNVSELPEDVQAAVRAHGVTADTLNIHDRYETRAQYAAN